MKFALSAILVAGVFCVLASLTIDAATLALGKPSRGVSYGIGIHYLNLAVWGSGCIALAATKWLGRARPMAIGTIAVFACGVILFPQPGLGARIGLGLALALILGAAIALLSRINE